MGRRLLGFLATAVLLGAIVTASHSSAAEGSGSAAVAEAGAPNGSDIWIVEDTQPSAFCLPRWFALTRTVESTPTAFILTIKAAWRLCNPVNAKAVVYEMPGNGVAWPQTLREVEPFTISQKGTYTVTFSKHCDPVQFDVLTGATPSQIAPWGPWHGPLLFPFDLATSFQHFPGPGCQPTTTTTTIPGGECDDYTPDMVVVDPTTVIPGGSVTISGSGVPNDTVTATLEPGSTLLGSAVAGPTGAFSITGTIPAATTPGNYEIVVVSIGCPASTIVTISVEAPVEVDVSTGQGGRTIPQGSTVKWGLRSEGFDRSRSVELRMTRGASVRVLHNGAWPDGNIVTFTVPEQTDSGEYEIVQIGADSSAQTLTSTPSEVRVEEASDTLLASPTGNVAGGDDGSPNLLVGIGSILAGAYALIRLSNRRTLRRSSSGG